MEAKIIAVNNVFVFIEAAENIPPNTLRIISALEVLERIKI